MRSLLAAILLIFFIGCANTIPTDSASIANKISIDRDEFNNTTTISTPLYLSSQGITDTFPVRLKFRAYYDDKMQSSKQLYVVVSNVDWGFYDRAIGQDSEPLEFIQIARNIDSGGGGVTVDEHFALSLQAGYLEKMSLQDWKIKVYGKKNRGVFTIPANLSKTFLEKLKCFESQNCT